MADSFFFNMSRDIFWKLALKNGNIIEFDNLSLLITQRPEHYITSALIYAKITLKLCLHEHFYGNPAVSD